jgi:hypothetical protein
MLSGAMAALGHDMLITRNVQMSQQVFLRLLTHRLQRPQFGDGPVDSCLAHGCCCVAVSARDSERLIVVGSIRIINGLIIAQIHAHLDVLAHLSHVLLHDDCRVLRIRRHWLLTSEHCAVHSINSSASFSLQLCGAAVRLISASK